MSGAGSRARRLFARRGSVFYGLVFCEDGAARAGRGRNASLPAADRGCSSDRYGTATVASIHL